MSVLDEGGWLTSRPGYFTAGGGQHTCLWGC